MRVFGKIRQRSACQGRYGGPPRVISATCVRGMGITFGDNRPICSSGQEQYVGSPQKRVMTRDLVGIRGHT